MKYSITINQKSVIENGWDLCLDHLAILETVVGMINSNNFISINDTNGTWYWCKVSKILNELPLLKIKERRCKDLINDLCFNGLLEVNPNNQNLGAHYIRIGKNYKKYVFSDPTQKIADPTQKIADPTQKIADPLRNILQTPYAENCIPPTQKIADYNSNNINNNTNYNTTRNNSLHACENSQGATLKTGVALSQQPKTSILETELLNTPPVASHPPSLKKEKKDKVSKWWHKHLNELKAPFEEFSKKAFGCGIMWSNGRGTKQLGLLIETLELSVLLSDNSEQGKIEFMKSVLKSVVSEEYYFDKVDNSRSKNISKKDYWNFPEKNKGFIDNMDKFIKSVHSILNNLVLAKENAYIFKNGFVDAKTEQRNENLKKIQQAEINLINQINSL